MLAKHENNLFKMTKTPYRGSHLMNYVFNYA